MQDPVCGMDVDPTNTAHYLEHVGETYYFCSAGCAAKFVGDPEHYLLPPDERPAPIVAPGTQYTCPMHPEIIRDEPGSCPICGMALEPMGVSLDDGPNPELADFTRRFRFGAVLTVPLLGIVMGDLLPGVHFAEWIGSPWYGALQFVLGTPVILWSGKPFFERGWASVVTRNLNMFTLIALGTGAAVHIFDCCCIRTGNFPRRFPWTLRWCRNVLRSCGGHHCAGPSGAGDGVAGARTDQWRVARAPRSGAENRAPDTR